MNLKVFIVLVVLLAALAVFALGRGFTRGSDSPGSSRPDWASRLGSLLVQKRPLRAADVQPVGETCLTGGAVQLPAGGSCLLRLTAAQIPVRQVQVSGDQAFVAVLEQPKGVPVRSKGTSLKADLFRDGGSLSLACPLAPCTIRLFTP